MINEENIWYKVLGALGGSSLILSIVAWARFKKKDKADIRKLNAESDQIVAEASKTRSESETTIAEMAIKLAEKVGIECDDLRVKLKDMEASNTRMRLLLIEVISVTSEIDDYLDDGDDEPYTMLLKTRVDELRHKIKSL